MLQSIPPQSHRYFQVVLCSQQVWKDTVVSLLCDPLMIRQKSRWMLWMYIQAHNATGRMPVYTLHTRCSCQSLEALHKGSNFEMVSTYPLILYFLNLKFWKKKRVQHISSESQLHSMCNIHTTKWKFKCYWRKYLFLCFYMIANIRKFCPKLGSDRYFLGNISVACCSQKYSRYNQEVTLYLWSVCAAEQLFWYRYRELYRNVHWSTFQDLGKVAIEKK